MTVDLPDQTDRRGETNSPIVAVRFKTHEGGHITDTSARFIHADGSESDLTTPIVAVELKLDPAANDGYWQAVLTFDDAEVEVTAAYQPGGTTAP